jgi:uncharacterized membrane protein
MGLALIASLAVNVLVLGAIATAAWRHRHWQQQPSQATVYAFTRTLSDARRREVLDAIAEERRVLRPFRAELRRSRAEVRAALVAQPFDIERYRRANEAMLAAEMRARGHAQKLFEGIVTRLTDPERAELARWLARSERPWRRRGVAPGSTDEADPGGTEGGGAAQQKR